MSGAIVLATGGVDPICVSDDELRVLREAVEQAHAAAYQSLETAREESTAPRELRILAAAACFFGWYRQLLEKADLPQARDREIQVSGPDANALLNALMATWGERLGRQDRALRAAYVALVAKFARLSA